MSISTVQRRPNELVDVLRPDFQHRNEPNFAWKSAVSSILAIPGLVGAWPMSCVRVDAAADQGRDIAGAGYHLTNTNTVLFGHALLRPYAYGGGTNEYLVRTAGAASWASIIGNEAHIDTSDRGLTMGCWVAFDATPNTNDYIMAKFSAAAGNFSYYLRGDAAGVLQGGISTDGTALISEAHTTAIDTTWHFAAMRFSPSDRVLSVWWDGDQEDSAAGAAATIFDGTADFTILSRNGGNSPMAGFVSLCWLSQCALPDVTLFSLFQQQRALFGK